MVPSARAEEKAELRPAVASPHPTATDVRVAGDEKRARFILQLDRKIDLHAFALANPYRIVVDVPQVTFLLPEGVGDASRGLVKAFRYGLVMPGGSRIVMDLKRPAKIDKAYVLEAENGQLPKLIVELSATDRATFMQGVAAENRKTAAAPSDTTATTSTVAANADAGDTRPVVVIDPGHGGIDHGAQTQSGENEKEIVLDFAKALRERIEKGGKYRVVMTRDDDTFIPLAERVRIARQHKAALFLSIHADSLPRGEGDAQGATVYTLSDTASDAEAAKLAESENRADLIAGINLTEEPADVADILIDLARRETKTFSNRFARSLVKEMKTVARLHKNPLKSAGFRVLKAPDVPSVLLELGYVSNKEDLQLLVSDSWRSRTVGSVAQAVELFFGKRLMTTEAKKDEH
ncbi:N-acetylmuramoyl-L-alanine amidase [Bradyrhizobium sp. LHD-71]|uniref:N-acetylmuramoyl-L-alanine amidase n=1 Tax=Bradyrhizobium sp. LHD-71 TaxID=3072141 RepID=UPI00280D8024|nr:N-acetylmuramoyl-L-alanine amidase [Bradyrhizobium sp. LHD-71]MDQ8729984.1 N-acetylmuramoyl-L-alanine amidase [Bradyrhizobium sp. LHD-71]